jgi:murein DD-endopeptidase MepM/ murein hydrolase activator NlpD
MNPLFWSFFCALFLASAAARADEIPMGTPPVLDVSSSVLSSSPMAGVEASTPVVVEPYHCPLSKCVVVSVVGTRPVPGKTTTERHEGVDFRVTPGQTLRAARSGKVIFAGFSKAYVSRADKRDQQRLVIIQNADGQSARYVHLNTLAVRPPQAVKAGDVIGTASESDEGLEPVLHFEIRSAGGAVVNPAKYFKADRPANKGKK